MARSVWLLCVQIGHDCRYYATDAVAPVDITGAVLAHSPTLDPPTYEEAFDPRDRTVTTAAGELTFLAPEIDPWSLIRAGLHPALWLAELSLWTEGTAYGERRIIVSGPLRVQRIPDPGEPWRASISTSAPLLRLPTPSQVVTTATLAAPLAADLGRPYPILLGPADGYVDDDGDAQATKRSYVRVLGFDVSATVAQKFMICGHWLADTGTEYDATTGDCELYSVPDAAFITAPMVEGVDARGNPYTYVDNTGLGDWAGITDDEDAEIYLVNTYGRGPRDPRSPYAIQGVGSLLRWLLSSAGYLLDEGAWGAVLPYLNTLRTAGAITEQVDVAEWQDAQVRDALPNFALLSGPRGLAPVVLRDDLPPDDFLLEQGRNAWRPEGDREECSNADDLLESVAVDFAFRERTGEYRATVTVGRGDVDGAVVAPDARARAIFSYGRASQMAMEVDWTGDRQTAARIAALWLHFRGYITGTWRTTIPVDADGPHLRLGAFGRYTDAERRLDGAPCYVIGRALEADLMTLTLWRLVGAPAPPAS